jgi:hypothetical protein
LTGAKINILKEKSPNQEKVKTCTIIFGMHDPNPPKTLEIRGSANAVKLARRICFGFLQASISISGI